MNSSEEIINQLVNRAIAKCLGDLGQTLSPSQQKTIKMHFRFLQTNICEIQEDIRNKKDEYRNHNY